MRQLSRKDLDGDVEVFLHGCERPFMSRLTKSRLFLRDNGNGKRGNMIWDHVLLYYGNGERGSKVWDHVFPAMKSVPFVSDLSLCICVQ